MTDDVIFAKITTPCICEPLKGTLRFAQSANRGELIGRVKMKKCQDYLILSKNCPLSDVALLNDLKF